MELSIPPPEVAHAGLRALSTIAAADGVVHPLERDLLKSVQSILLHTSFDVDALDPITPAELAALVPPGAFRERILRGCTLMALTDAEASANEARSASSSALALDLDAAPLHDFSRILHGRLQTLRIDIVRRSFIGKRVGQHFADKGVRGMVEIARTFRGTEVKALADRYRSLETYPVGTLGRAYAEFIRANEFSMPGEAFGAPEPIAFHDCVHVLAGYDTTPEEEVLAASYQAGFQSYDPFFSLLFVLCQFHLGLQISPIAGVEKMQMKPATMLEAFVRGSRCTRDLSDGWDPWDPFASPLDALRAEYHIDVRVPPPRTV